MLLYLGNGTCYCVIVSPSYLIDLCQFQLPRVTLKGGTDTRGPVFLWIFTRTLLQCDHQWSNSPRWPTWAMDVSNGSGMPPSQVKVKVKVHILHTLDIAPLRSEIPQQKRSGMARVLKGFHSFTCTPTRSFAIGMSHTSSFQLQMNSSGSGGTPAHPKFLGAPTYTHTFRRNERPNLAW